MAGFLEILWVQGCFITIFENDLPTASSKEIYEFLIQVGNCLEEFKAFEGSHP